MRPSDSQASITNHRPPHGWGSLFSPFHVVLQLLLAALYFFANELDRIFNLWFALVPIIGIPTIAVGAIWIGGIARNIIHRRWLLLGRVVVAPLLVWPLLFLLLRTGFDAHWMRFKLNKHGYEESVRKLEVAHPIYNSWDWGSTGGAAAANIFYSLIYDESDRVVLSDGKNAEGGITTVRQFGDHFYLVTLVYQ
jgi:hypothetical protein